jgi:hypothetical protein
MLATILVVEEKASLPEPPVYNIKTRVNEWRLLVMVSPNEKQSTAKDRNE